MGWFTVKKKKSDEGNTHYYQQDDNDVPFGPPPIMFNYQCKKCKNSSEMNEAIVDAAYGWSKKRTISSYGKVPVLECPECGNMAFVCID
jgi:hypothetical protein